MSLIRRDDYVQASKHNKTKSPRRASHGGVSTSKKIRLATQDKSKQCSLCNNIATTTVQVSKKETRKLCSKHLADWKRKDFKYSVKFERGTNG